MKPEKVFYGNDTYGRNVELAQSSSGKWFGRSYEWNGYGKGWTRWDEMDAPEVDENGTHYWGFNKLRAYGETPRYRLPA